MLSINAMVKVGPWTIQSVHRNPIGQSCERCQARLKEVWTCIVDPDYGDMAKLEGKTTWEIGSTCGPTLIEVSEQVWKESTKLTSKRLGLLRRLEALDEVAKSKSYEFPALLNNYHAPLTDGTISERHMRHMGLVLTTHERKLGMRK